MNHLEGHPHAFLDENNIVKAVLIFESHESPLLAQVQESLSAVSIKCCCDYGAASSGDEFFNTKFYPPKPYPEWVRDEELGQWVAPKGWVSPED